MRIDLAGLAALMARVADGEAARGAFRAGVDTLADAVRERLSHGPGEEHDAPWMQSGALRDSVGVSMDQDGWRGVVGSSDAAASPQELGTVHAEARPFLAPVAVGEGEGLARRILDRVGATLAKGET